jgi:hypothetical protein
MTLVKREECDIPYKRESIIHRGFIRPVLPDKHAVTTVQN